MRTCDVQRLLDRRRRLLHLTTVGLNVTLAVDNVCEEYHCAQSTVWHDWNVRDKWIPLLLKMGPEDKDRVVMDALASLHEARQAAFNTYAAAEGMIRVAALRLFLDAVKAEIEMRQTLGLLPTEPLKIQHRIVMLQGRFVEVGSDGKLVGAAVAKPALPGTSSTAIVPR